MARSNFFKGPNEKFGASVIWDQISELRPQKGRPSSPKLEAHSIKLNRGQQVRILSEPPIL